MSHHTPKNSYKLNDGLIQMLNTKNTPVKTRTKKFPQKMKSSSNQESPPLYPSLSSPKESPMASPFSSSPNKQEKQSHDELAPSSSSSPPPCNIDSGEKWPGTHIMGQPAVPTSHPDNKKAALFGAGGGDQGQQYYHHPYLQVNPVDKPSNSPMESILHKFNSWGKKAETMANDIWHNRMFNSYIRLIYKFNLILFMISHNIVDCLQ